MDNFEHTPKYPVQTLGKALDILNYIKDNPSSEGVSLTEISKALGIGKSGVHRLLDTLMAYNFIEKNSENTTSYRLGWGLYHAGNAVPKQHVLSGSNYIAVVEKLCKTFMETVNLGIFSNYEVIVIHQVGPNRMLRTNTEIGEREPLYCTALGKLFLSELTDEEIRRYYEKVKPESKTEKTIVTAEGMIKELAEVRKKGYSEDNEEYVDGMSCVAMPIRDFMGKIKYGISVSGPTSRMTEEKRTEILTELEKACGEIASFLGYSV